MTAYNNTWSAMFQSLVGAMRTFDLTSLGVSVSMFQSLVGAMRTSSESISRNYGSGCFNPS